MMIRDRVGECVESSTLRQHGTLTFPSPSVLIALVSMQLVNPNESYELQAFIIKTETILERKVLLSITFLLKHFDNFVWQYEFLY